MRKMQDYIVKGKSIFIRSEDSERRDDSGGDEHACPV
jgi:hypothetical protein